MTELSIWSRLTVSEANRARQEGRYLGPGLPTPCLRGDALVQARLGVPIRREGVVTRPSRNPERIS